ncbi:MAG: TraB/GumN family protein [Candidatus Altiarchaeota archaeon]|nr:TraB/GumN family protein [Candidatus Altiarchaeota archaeon]
MDNVEKVVLADKTVYLVGTAHVSDESVKDVENTIDSAKPDVVAVELCEQRFRTLKEGRKWEETEITDVIKSGRMYLFLLQILLTNFQRKIGAKVGVNPGAEMMKAVNMAEARGIKVALVDRSIGVTLKRAISKITFGEKVKLASGLLGGLFSDEEVDKELIEKMKQRDVLTGLIDELSRDAPSIKKVLVDERDRYIALMLSALDAKNIVAVIGAGHVDGVKANLLEIKGAGTEVERKVLEEVSGKRKKSVNYASYAIPAIFLLVLAAGFILKGPELAVNMIIWWILAHSILAALGVILMMGHPASIAVAALTAPFTPFHPLSVGMLSATTEFSMRKPRVSDFTGLLNLSGLRDYYRNRVTRIFFIMIAADLCNNMASLIVLPYITKIIV